MAPPTGSPAPWSVSIESTSSRRRHRHRFDEYYDNQRDLASAESVSVRAGHETSGIDAVLDPEGTDTTPPTIELESVSTDPNGAGWYRSSVTFTWQCADDGSAVVETEVSQTVSAGGENQSVTGTCVNGVGLEASSTEYGINIDLTAPTATWDSTLTGEYIYGTVPAAPTCSAHDALSGPNGCAVTGYSTDIGTHELVATAEDVAGNTGSAANTLTYTVLPWTFRGFRPPVSMNAWNVVAAGSALPLKFEVFAGTTELTETAVVTDVTTAPTTAACLTAAPRLSGIQTPVATGTLSYDTSAGFFALTWKVPSTHDALWAVSVTTQDGVASDSLRQGEVAGQITTPSTWAAWCPRTSAVVKIGAAVQGPH